MCPVTQAFVWKEQFSPITVNEDTARAPKLLSSYSVSKISMRVHHKLSGQPYGRKVL
jgi:hypothetical protein